MTKTTLPWWETLPDDFHLQPYTTEIHRRHPVKVKVTAAMDILLRTGAATALLATMAPRMFFSRRWQKDIQRTIFYRDLVDLADASRVFEMPPRTVNISCTTQAKGLHKLPSDAIVDMLEFESPYQAVNPDVRNAYASFTHNRRVRAQHWRHIDGPRKTLIFIHGFFADAYWLNSLMFSLRWFYKKGYDVLLYTLPFHGNRRGPLDLFSGYGYFANGIAHVNEAMIQGVYDLRILMNYLEDSGVPAMGVSGLSLGGYVSALAATVDARLAFVIPNAPAVLVSDMLMDWTPISWVTRFTMRQSGLSKSDVRHIVAVHSPLSYPPIVPADRLLVIGGAGDRFTPPHHVRLLHQHWNGSRMHWFPGNHVLHLHQSKYLYLMKNFMDDCCQRPIIKNKMNAASAYSPNGEVENESHCST